MTNDEIRKQISELSFGKTLDKKEVETLQKLIFEHKKAFSWSDWDLGRTKVMKHNIKTNSSRPVRQPTSRIPMALRPIVEKKVREMEENAIIRPSTSSWSSRIVMVKKKDGDWRFCVDFRDLNRVTEKEVYPLTRIDEAIDTLYGSKYFTCIDIKNGYWQMEIEEEDRHKTAFTTTNGSYEFCVMPFGLTNAPARFQRLMNTILKDLTWHQCIVYLDDVVIFSKTFEEHVETKKRFDQNRTSRFEAETE
jgi:hypothetical protein